MSANSCLDKGQMYWLVMAAASLASLSERLWEGKNQGYSIISGSVDCRNCDRAIL